LVMKKVFSFDVTDANGVKTPVYGGGITRDAHLIEFAWIDYPRPDSLRNNIVHEMGHAFNDDHDPAPAASLPSNYKNDRSLFLHDNSTVMWQANTLNTNSETFADMFVAYTYGVWGDWNSLNSQTILQAHNQDATTWNPPQWMDDHMRTWVE